MIQASQGKFGRAEDAFDQSDRLLARLIRERSETLGRPIAVGLCGAQGSGKSTTAARIAAILDREHYRTAVLSIDDFYLLREERLLLAENIHPLLATRGVPGTHDIELCLRTIDALTRQDGAVDLPAFDKLADNRAPREFWRHMEAPVAVVLLEGWCVGARPMPSTFKPAPINELERYEDADGRWRRYLSEMLAGPYQTLFARLDLKALLLAPSFQQIHRWRSEQEAGLAHGYAGEGKPMSDVDIARFIAHYERLTSWIMEDRPAEVVIEIDEERKPLSWCYQPS